MDQLELKYLDYLHSSLENVSRILRHQLLTVFIFTIFFLYVIFLRKSREPLSVPFISMEIEMEEIIVYCPLILGFSYMSFCLFQFYRKVLHARFVSSLERFGLKRGALADEGLGYVVYPSLLDVMSVVRESALTKPAKGIFYVASFAQAVLVYFGPLVAQCFLVGKALETVPPENTLLKAFLYGSFVVPLLGITVVTQEWQQRFLGYVDAVGKRVLRSMVLVNVGKVGLSLVVIGLVLRYYLVHKRISFLIVGIVLCVQMLSMISIQSRTISRRGAK